MYDNLLNKFTWGGLKNPDVYLDETNTRMVMNFRNNFARLAEALISNGKKDSALVVLEKCVEEMPNTTAPFNIYAFPLVNAYYQLNANEKGNIILAQMIETFLAEFKYLNALKDNSGLNQNIQIAGSVLSNVNRLIQNFNLTDKSFEYLEKDGEYFRDKDGSEEKITKDNYLINTFMDEYVAVQQQNR